MIRKLIIGVFLVISLISPSYSVEREINCLSELVYFETKGESKAGKRMVAAVAVNRSNHKLFPDGICKNMYMKKQFTFVSNKSRKIVNSTAYKESKRIAQEIYYNGHNYPKNMLYFATTETNKKWMKKKIKYKIVGNHKFYLEP